MTLRLVLPPSANLRPQFDRDAYVICHDVLRSDTACGLREKALHIASRHARRIEQQSADHPLRYRVVTGDVIATEWPELFASYQSSELREWVAAVTGVSTICPSSHLRSAININIMGEPGEVYRWHTDAVGVTLLLYLSNSREEDGGSLEMRAPDATTTTTLAPAAGDRGAHGWDTLHPSSGADPRSPRAHQHSDGVHAEFRGRASRGTG